MIIVQGLALCKPKPRDLDVFANVPVGVYRTTADGQFLDANPALVQMLGYPDRESLVATRAVDLYIDPGARERWIAALERAVRYGAYSLAAVERILAAQARPKGVLEALAEEEQRSLLAAFTTDPVTPRPTSDYQPLLPKEPDDNAPPSDSCQDKP